MCIYKIEIINKYIYTDIRMIIIDLIRYTTYELVMLSSLYYINSKAHRGFHIYTVILDIIAIISLFKQYITHTDNSINN